MATITENTKVPLYIAYGCAILAVAATVAFYAKLDSWGTQFITKTEAASQAKLLEAQFKNLNDNMTNMGKNFDLQFSNLQARTERNERIMDELYKKVMVAK